MQHAPGIRLPQFESRFPDEVHGSAEASNTEYESGNVNNQLPVGSGPGQAVYRTAFLAAAVLGAVVSPGVARAQAEADPADVESIDGIVAALYDVISGEAGEARDWGRFESLFVSDGRLMPTWSQESRAQRLSWGPAEYGEAVTESLERSGFFETELHREVQQFGQVAHVFSTYESRNSPEDETPFARGINSIQLFHDGTRWWIVTVFWASERPDLPVPAEYLPGGGG